jgi:hypothetical protein
VKRKIGGGGGGHDEEFHKSFLSFNIIRVIKEDEMDGTCITHERLNMSTF